MADRATSWGIGPKAKRITIQQAQTLLDRVASWLSYTLNERLAFHVHMEYPDGREYPIYNVYGPHPPTGAEAEAKRLLYYGNQEPHQDGRLLLATQNTHTMYAFALGVAWAHDMLLHRPMPEAFKPMNITLEPEPEPEPEPAPPTALDALIAALEGLKNQAAAAKKGK